MIALTLTSVDDAKHHARQWLFESAAPLWSTAGVLPDGMFAERLNLDGSPITAINRRLRVQARQIYSFVTLGALQWEGPWIEIVTNALAHLVGKGRRGDGLFVHLFDQEGQVCNSSLDLYDHAFGLFALGHAAIGLNRDDLARVAIEIGEIMMATWWRPEGGFWEGELTPCPPFRQNPHMHMFEAALVNQRASGAPLWQDMAERLSGLAAQAFQDPATGAITEYFDRDWGRLEAGTGDIVEPGHCMEWAWLFGQKGAGGVAVADRLTGFARRFGIDDKKGVCINEVYLDGRVRDGGARLWPQTERLKAAIARFRRTRAGEDADEIVAAYRGLSLYLATDVPGVWRDRLTDAGTWIDEPAPASSFYHIVCALDELLRLDA